MATLLYHLDVCSVGENVPGFLREQRLILFAEPVPPDIAQWCVVHRPHGQLSVLLPGQRVKINQQLYSITATGSVATANLKQLGHITFVFDGAIHPELPGSVHLWGPVPDSINAGDQIDFYDVAN